MRLRNANDNYFDFGMFQFHIFHIFTSQARKNNIKNERRIEFIDVLVTSFCVYCLCCQLFYQSLIVLYTLG